MIVKLELFGYMDVNCWYYGDDETKCGYLIDPGADGERIYRIIKENGWIIEKILLTHGHFDHIGGIPKLKQYLDIPVYIHENGAKLLKDPMTNLSGWWTDEKIVVNEFKLLSDGDTVNIYSGKLPLKVIHTPGHTFDSCIYYNKDKGIAFTGDTIFKGTIGRYDLPTSNRNELFGNIINKVLKLPENTVLYPGHGDETTVKAEKRHYKSAF